jgi:hypothetical protein
MYAYCENNPITRTDENGDSWYDPLIDLFKIVKETVSNVYSKITFMIYDFMNGTDVGGSVNNSVGAISTTIGVFELYDQAIAITDNYIIHTINVINIGSGSTNKVLPFKNAKIGNIEEYIESIPQKYEVMCNRGYIEQGKSWNDLTLDQRTAAVNDMLLWDNKVYKQILLNGFSNLIQIGFETAY